ncbi:MAG: hypothetical protein MJZ28_07885 [Paludibacteraceae bacterium]|nr:hypothetical protein [Paludibacteraceae bacterium]
MTFLIIPLLPLIGAALLGAAVSPLITFTLIKLAGWDEEKVKKDAKKQCPEADKLKVAKKEFTKGSYHLDLGLWAKKEQKGTLPVEVKRCPDSVYVGKEIYLDC